MPDVALHVNGAIYRNWKELGIHRGMDDLAGSFNLSITDPRLKTGEWLGGKRIKRGNACSVSIDGETVITGYVGKVRPRFTDTTKSISVTGRDTTGDLVDCSAINKPSEWSGYTLDRLVGEIVKPFGIKLHVQTDIGRPFERFALQPGESAFQAIDRACKQRGVLPMADGLGGLVLCRAGIGRHATALEEGKNLKAAGGDFSMDQRHSEYIVIGQQPGFETGAAADFAHGAARVTDSAVMRYRPLMIVAEQPGDGGNLKDRAIWECNTRIGRGDAVDATVFGWREHGLTGPLWKPNNLVRVKSPDLDFDGELLIQSVDYNLKDGDGSDAGTTATLNLVRKEAFALLPAPPVKGLWQ
ncbi:phage baseplate assembly protein [Ferrovibrio terrae]|uniref:phage baseplate assembly protein n=1 Tax=Ferrovibrio terrae TaxID=2594003 RepID=UPI003137D987